MASEQKYLYVVFAATPYKMGRVIRLVTREPYNHVAISLDADLSRLYTFARRYYRTPFYGGFVTEEPYRYHHKGHTAQIRVCRLPITAKQADDLKQKLRRMSLKSDIYIYNHLSALAATVHRRVFVPDAYTCAEFTVSILNELDYGFDLHTFYTIGDIAERLEAYQVYEGDFPATSPVSSLFFASRPIPHPIRTSLRDIFALVRRRASC